MSVQEFIITAGAASRIQTIIGDQKLSSDHALRIIVEGGGCSGFQYKMQMDDQRGSDDHVFTHNQSMVVIDSVSIDYLRGSTLEFEDSLGGAFLKIKNPNASSSCGCGVSFDMKN